MLPLNDEARSKGRAPSFVAIFEYVIYLRKRQPKILIRLFHYILLRYRKSPYQKLFSNRTTGLATFSPTGKKFLVRLSVTWVKMPKRLQIWIKSSDIKASKPIEQNNSRTMQDNTAVGRSWQTKSSVICIHILVFYVIC